jgi:hypothetical protein
MPNADFCPIEDLFLGPTHPNRARLVRHLLFLPHFIDLHECTSLQVIPEQPPTVKLNQMFRFEDWRPS